MHFLKCKKVKQLVQSHNVGNDKKLKLSSSDGGQHVEQTQSSESSEAVIVLQASSGPLHWLLQCAARIQTLWDSSGIKMEAASDEWYTKVSVSRYHFGSLEAQSSRC